MHSLHDRPAEDGYFQDKAELLRAVVAHQADMVLAAQQPQLRPERSGVVGHAGAAPTAKEPEPHRL